MIWLIGVGGAFGAAARYLIGSFIGRYIDQRKGFPFATLLVNVSGSALLGVVAYLHFMEQVNEEIWLLVSVGFFSAYTTFSTFGYETVTMIEKNEWKKAIVYVSASVVLSILVTFFSWRCTMYILK
ncbi:fluoride efflux transporter CrcB [Bacillus sp. FSL W7-1360]